VAKLNWVSLADFRTQMRLVLKVNPSVCVAAYFVDYEDYRGDCIKDKPFPRLSAVRRILDQVVNH
ncbi:hypothetical protein IscW_ISCW024246, partial [Ixodes scapularis]